MQDVSHSFKDMKLRAEFSSAFLCLILVFFDHFFRGKLATLHCGLTIFVSDGRRPQQDGGAKQNWTELASATSNVTHVPRHVRPSSEGDGVVIVPTKTDWRYNTNIQKSLLSLCQALVYLQSIIPMFDLRCYQSIIFNTIKYPLLWRFFQMCFNIVGFFFTSYYGRSRNIVLPTTPLPPKKNKNK